MQITLWTRYPAKKYVYHLVVYYTKTIVHNCICKEHAT